jgi:hypothetical protein
MEYELAINNIVKVMSGTPFWNAGAETLQEVT